MKKLLDELENHIIQLTNTYCKIREKVNENNFDPENTILYYNESTPNTPPIFKNYKELFEEKNLDNLKELEECNDHQPEGESKNMALLEIKEITLGKKKRKDGRYMGKYINNDITNYFYAKSYEQLEKIALDIVQGRKKFNNKTLLTFEKWANKWLEIYHKKKTTETTFKNDKGIFKNHILPHLANKALSNINGLEIQETINKCPFPRQRQIVANLLTACLRKAYEIDLLKKDITKAVEKPKHTHHEGKALTKQEEKKLLEHLKGHELELYIILLLNSGLRRNEGLALQWKHLDFENNNILVEQQVTMSNTITTRLKTKTSKRIIKMFPIIKSTFEPLKGERENRLFHFDPDYVSREFKKVCDTIGLKFSIKGNRTTFATRCAEYGIADKVVQAWLGHSKLDTTVNVYQKTNDEFIEQEFGKIIKKKDY